MDDLVAAVKARKGLESLDDDFVRERIEKVLRSDKTILDKYAASRDFGQFSRSKEYEKLLKAVRRELRTIYGVFQETGRGRLLATGSIDRLLASHTSTRERLPYYDRIYKELADRIPAPKKLLDLGCGMNPLSYGYMVRHGWRPFILASDISSADMDFLSRCFAVLGIPGKAFRLDVTKEFSELRTSDADVTFMLKLVDSLEEVERYITYKIIENLLSPWIVVSFPTKSLGGRKRISMRGRSWFERLLHRKSMPFEMFSVENELFYVIRNTA